MSWYGPNGLKVYDNCGNRSEADYCPCGCPDFEGRSIIYVDKHATGTGDGSSWADAFTSIQDAIDAYPKREIQIKGYGDGDVYSESVKLLKCCYLKGVDDLYITSISGYNGGLQLYTKLENLSAAALSACKNSTIAHVNISDNVQNCPYSFFDNCNINILYNNPDGNTLFTSCVFDKYVSGSPYSSFTDCTVTSVPYGGHHGFNSCSNSTFVNCSVLESEYGYAGDGFRSCSNSTFVNCSAANVFFGFSYNSNSEFTDCSTSNCQSCGFYNNNDSIFTNCSESNNCLGLLSTCTPGDPSYNCDEV